MVLNGEGALHEEAKQHHNNRVFKLLKGLEEAKKLGKKAYLINCVWYHMEPHWSDLLKSLDGVSVREVCSQEEMKNLQGVKPEMYLDLSYSCKIDKSKGSDEFAGKDVIGTIYARNMPRFGAFTHKHRMFKGMAHLSLGGIADKEELEYRHQRSLRNRILRRIKPPCEDNKTSKSLNHVSFSESKCVGDWSYIVNSLQCANLYVTGQHHSVYAACRARTPFAVFEVNTHKLRGLFKWAGVNIPIAKTRQQLAEVIEWAKNHKDVYERLFDWMEEQPVWPGI
jgi:hypothetical protein